MERHRSGPPRHMSRFPTAVMSDRQRRLTVCHLYIGLDHLAYNAHLEDWGEVAAGEERLDTLVS